MKTEKTIKKVNVNGVLKVNEGKKLKRRNKKLKSYNVKKNKQKQKMSRTFTMSASEYRRVSPPCAPATPATRAPIELRGSVTLFFTESIEVLNQEIET